jgi:endo-1,4-beta-xylanase
MNRKEFFGEMLTIAASVICASESPQPVSAQPISEKSAAGSLKAIGTRCGFRVGCQSEKVTLQVPEFANFVKANFDLMTPGNELKWGRLRPSADIFNFADGDWMVDFAQSNGMRVHGHNLCWNRPGYPQWLDAVLTKQNARQYLAAHITTVMQHYAGRIDSWDVVNEPVVPWSQRADGLYPGIWINLIGPDYIDFAFQAAAAADPKALRVLNCYQVEQDTPDHEKNRQNVLALLKRLISRQVPIQAVGIESHLDASVPLGGARLAEFLTDIRQLGLQVLITELDINDTAIPNETRDVTVAKTYHDYLKLVSAAVTPNSIIFWTVSDKFDWMNSIREPRFQRADKKPHRSGLIDYGMNPKIAYRMVADALHSNCRPTQPAR